VPNEPKPDEAELLGQIISSLTKLEPDARKRLYQTIGTYFDLDAGRSVHHQAPSPVAVEDFQPPTHRSPTFQRSAPKLLNSFFWRSNLARMSSGWLVWASI
jgi:hypothetical protein